MLEERRRGTKGCKGGERKGVVFKGTLRGDERRERREGSWAPARGEVFLIKIDRLQFKNRPCSCLLLVVGCLTAGATKARQPQAKRNSSRRASPCAAPRPTALSLFSRTGVSSVECRLPPHGHSAPCPVPPRLKFSWPSLIAPPPQARPPIVSLRRDFEASTAQPSRGETRFL